jgi:hypothetical protein
MQYQIRYQQAGQDHTDHIEANSPHEAVVKFEQIRRYRPVRGGDSPRVTSVSAATPNEKNPCWISEQSGPEII